MGMMFAIFSSLGKEPSSRERVTMWVIIQEREALFSLKIMAGKLSHPTEQFFNLSTILLISWVVVGFKNKLTVKLEEMKLRALEELVGIFWSRMGPMLVK